MDRKEYKRSAFHNVVDPRTGEIKRVVGSSDTEIGTSDINANLTVHGTSSLGYATGDYASFPTGYIGQLTVGTETISNLTVSYESVTTLTAVTASITSGTFTHTVTTTGSFTNMDARSGSFYSTQTTTASFTDMNARSGSFYGITATSGSFTDLNATRSGSFNYIESSMAKISSGAFTNMNVTQTGSFGKIEVGTIRAASMSVSQITGQYGNLMLAAARPDNFPGLQWWLEADSGITTFNVPPAKVTAWANLTGDGKQMQQLTIARLPLYNAANTSVSGSKPSVDFQANGYLSSSVTCAISTFTMIIAMDNKTNGTMLVEHSPDLNSNDGHWLGSFVLPTGPCVEVKRSSTFCSKDQTTVGQYGAWATSYGGPAIYTMQHGGTTGSLRLQINNVDQNHLTTVTANNLGTTSTTQTLFIGARSGVALPSSGSWFAFILYTPAIPLYQAQEVVRYLGLKWGIPVGGF